MSKFTTTLKGLMALALGSFALSASAVVNPVTIDDATVVSSIPGESDNRAVYVIQSQERGGLYSQLGDAMQLACCGNTEATDGCSWNNDIAVSAENVNQQFAIITYEGKKYLYSVAGAGFITRSGNKAAINTENVTNGEITLTASAVNSVNYYRISVNGYILNHSGGYNKDTFKGIYLAASAGPDGGNRYYLQKLNSVTLTDDQYNTAIGIIRGAVDAVKTTQIARLNDIKEFYHNPSEIDGYISQISAATTESQVNEIVENVFDALDGKLVYLIYAPRESETDYKYLGVLGVDNYRIAQLLPQRGTRAKWQLKRVENTYTFKLRNIASDTYVNGSDNGQTIAGGSFVLEFKNNTSTEGGVSLKYYDNDRCLTVGSRTVGGITYQYALGHSVNVAGQSNEAANAWKIEPVGVAPAAIEEGYYVIRSNRGLTGSPNGYDDGFGGTLLGVYTADRTIARTNAGLSAGVHLRQYATGMHTIWKIVPTADGGYKIYSIIGDMEEGGNLGMHFEGGDSYVTLTNEPTTVYIRSIAQWNLSSTSPFPNGVVLCSDAESTSGSNCFDVANSLGNSSINADFFVKANGWYPEPQTSNVGTLFYIERVSDYDVEQAIASYVDYAAETRSFQLLKNVLSDDDIAYALSGKTTDPKSVTTVAQANKYLNEVDPENGNKVSSTLAFERLDGKVIRINNRQHSAYYMCPKSDDATKLATGNTNVDNSLNYLWEVEVVNAALRQVRLKNYVSGKYAGPMANANNTAITMVDDAANAGTYTISRYYSLDGKSLYANLLAPGNSITLNALHCGSGASYQVLRWVHSNLASHWTLMNAAADDVKNTQLDLSINAEGTVIYIKNAEGSGALTKTADFPETHKVTLTPAAAAAVAADEATATPVAVEIPDANISATTDGFDINLDGLNVVPSDYTLNIPAGYFTVNSKLAPAMSTAVKVEDTTSIKEIGTAEKTGATVIYDLQGRRVSNAGKGVYIINGVKTLVK